MKSFEKWGQGVISSALALFLMVGAFLVLMGGTACAQEKTVAEKILDIMLANHEINQDQYNALLKQSEDEKMAEARKIAEAQKAAAAAAMTTTPQVGTREWLPTDFHAYWNNGLRFGTDDKAFNLHLGGRLQADFADAGANSSLDKWATAASATKVEGYGDQLRRVRLDFDGTVWSNAEFIIQPDFAPSYTASSVVKSVSLSTTTATVAGTKVLTTATLSTSTTSVTQGTAITFADVWVGVKDIPYIGRIRVGQMEEPVSLEELTSDNFRTFMESGLPTAFVPKRNTGIEFLDNEFNQRMTWTFGYLFQQQVSYSANGVPTDTTGDLFSPHLDATQLALRLTGLPWYCNNGEQLIHLGVGYEHKFRSTTPNVSNTYDNPGTIDFKSSPEANIYSALVDTGNFLAQGVNIIDPEVAMVYGPFSIQGEFMWAGANSVTNTSGQPLEYTNPAKQTVFYDPNAQFYGWYAYASYFITGEHRPYNKVASPTDYQGTFGRLIPNCNFNPMNGGPGAWEVAFRVSQLNTNDSGAGFNGGQETDFTGGINWYLNPNVMVKIDYVHADVNQHGTAAPGVGGVGALTTTFPLLSAGSDNIIESRFQISF